MAWLELGEGEPSNEKELIKEIMIDSTGKIEFRVRFSLALLDMGEGYTSINDFRGTFDCGLCRAQKSTYSSFLCKGKAAATKTEDQSRLINFPEEIQSVAAFGGELLK